MIPIKALTLVLVGLLPLCTAGIQENQADKKQNILSAVSINEKWTKTAPWQTAPWQTAPWQTAPWQKEPWQTAPWQTAPFQTKPWQTASWQTAPWQTASWQTAPWQTASTQTRMLAGGPTPTSDQGSEELR